MADSTELDPRCDYESCAGDDGAPMTHDDSGNYHESCFDAMYAEASAHWARLFSGRIEQAEGGYEGTDPKHPTYAERLVDAIDAAAA